MPTMTAFSPMTRRAMPVAAIALAALLGGCDFNVTNPGPLLDEDLNNASAIPALVNGMGGDLSNAIGNYLTRGSLAALELVHSGNFAAERRFAAGTIGPEDVNGDWARMHTARYVAEAGLVRMKTVLGTGFETNANTPRAYLYAGFANRFLGENVCNAVYDGGPALPNSSHFVRAESLFTRALTISRALNNTALTNAALAGRAQVYADQGKWTEAAADAALVPTTFRHNAVFSLNTTRENMDLAAQTITRREVTVWNTVWVADRDPRVLYDTVKTGTTITMAQDRATNFFAQRGFKAPRDEAPFDIEATLRALESLRAAGKIRHIGIANETAWGLSRFLHLAAAQQLPRVVSIQNPYNLLNRGFDSALAEIAWREQCGLLAYAPLAGGLLSGKYADGSAGAEARLHQHARHYRQFSSPAAHAASARYVDIARAAGLAPAAMALAFVASKPYVTSVIIGATTAAQLASNLRAALLKLPRDVLRAIDAVHEEIPNPCP